MRLQESLITHITVALQAWNQADTTNKSVQLAIQHLKHHGIKIPRQRTAQSSVTPAHASANQPAQEAPRQVSQATSSNDKTKIKQSVGKLSIQGLREAVSVLEGDLAAIQSDIVRSRHHMECVSQID